MADKIPMPASGISTVADLYDLINGKTTETSGGAQTTSGGTTTKTETTGISKESFDAMLASALGSSQGLAAISSGQRAAGGYGSSVNTMLTNDLLTRTASNILANNTSKVTTTTTPDQTITKSPTIQTTGGVTASGVGKSASFLSALQLLQESGAGSWLKKNLKLDADGKPTADTAGMVASPAGQALQEFTPTMSAVSAADTQTVPMGSVDIASMMSPDTSDFGGAITSASGIDRSVEQTGSGDDSYVGSIGGGMDISESPITDAGVVTASDLETLEMPQLPDFGEGFADGGLVTPKKQLNVLGTSQFNRVVDPTLGLAGSRGVGVNELGQPDNSTPVTTPSSNPGGGPRGGSDFTGGNGGNLGSMDQYLTQGNYTNSTTEGGGASRGDIANASKGLSILGTLTGSTDLRNLGTAGKILSSDNPIMSAGLTAANIASKGVVGKGLSLYNTLTNPSTSSVSNLIITAANPALGVVNGIADLFGVANIGEVIENIADKVSPNNPMSPEQQQAVKDFKSGQGQDTNLESDFNSLPETELSEDTNSQYGEDFKGSNSAPAIAAPSSNDAGAFGESEAVATGLADGGSIIAPGDGTTDTTLRPLAHGEYVFPKDVVDAIGIDKLDAIKAKYHTPVAVQKLQKFAKGY